MTYVSLYRKWRPQDFSEVAGQQSIVKTLENSLDTGRISHAYLFAGPRGTGKTTVARILAKGLNCSSGPSSTPCGKCDECQAIAAGSSLNVIEIDGASNRGIEDVRELRSQVQFAPVNARYKVYIIDEVHMLTPEAFNALLKTLEEPPLHVVFIFATTDPHRLPSTILSRVQRFDFQRFTEQAVVERLQVVLSGEQLKAETEALRLIALHAAGGMRDALGILEKCAAFAEVVSVESVSEVLGIAPQEQVQLFVRWLLEDAKAEALQVVADLFNDGRDLGQFVLSVVAELRRGILEEVPQDQKQRQDQERRQDEERRLAAMALLAATLQEMRFAPDPRIPLELAALRICNGVTPSDDAEIERLEHKIEALETEISKLRSKPSGTSPQTREATPDGPTMLRPNATDQERSGLVLRVWGDYLQELRNERLMQCQAFLKEGTPLGVTDNNVIVAFPRDRGFHKASIEQDSHREPAERVLARLVGSNIHLRCVFQDETEPPAAEVERRPGAPDPTGEPQPKVETESNNLGTERFLELSRETFGGEIFTKPD